MTLRGTTKSAKDAKVRRPNPTVPSRPSATGAGKVRLGCVCEEFSVRNRDGKVSSVYSVTNSGGFIPSTEYFSKEVYSKSLATYKIVKPGMFAYNPSRINVGSVNRWIGEAPVIVSPLYIVVNPDPRRIEGSYLNYFLHSKEALCQIRNLTEGTVRDSLKFSGFQRLTLPLPPLPTQRRIAAELDRLCALKKNAEDRLARLDQLVKSRFVEMFGDPVTNAGGWPTDSLGNRCEITTGNTPPRLNPSNYGDFLEWVKSDNIVDGHLTEARECLSEQGARLSRRAAAGSLLMTCIAGSLNSIGNVALIDREVAFNQQLNAITPKCDDPYFLMWMFKLARPLLRDGINKCLKGILSKGTLSNKRFPFPPLALQREFAAFVASVDKSKAALRETVATLDQLYRAKLQEYFSDGERTGAADGLTRDRLKTRKEAKMQTIDEVKKHCRVVGEGIVAAVAAGEDLGKRFEGVQSITFRVEKNGSQIEVVGGEIAPDDSGIYTTEKGVFKFFGDELVGYAFDSETREAMREFFDTAYWC